MFFGTKYIIGLPCCYENTVHDVFLRLILPSYYGNTVTHQNQLLTSGGGGRGQSLVRNIFMFTFLLKHAKRSTQHSVIQLSTVHLFIMC